MSRVVKLLKKAAEKKEAIAGQIEPDFQNLEVSDIRKKLFEKIKERQSSLGPKKPVDLKGLSPEEGLLGIIQETEEKKAQPASRSEEPHDEYPSKISGLELENKKLAKLHEEALKEIDALRSQSEEKDRTISELQSKPAEDPEQMKKENEKAAANIESLRSKLYAATKEAKERSDRLSQLEEMLKNREKRLADSDKHYKKMETEKDEAEAKLKNAESAAEKLEAEASGLRSDIEEKEKKLADTGKQFNKNLELAKKEVLLHLQAAENGGI